MTSALSKQRSKPTELRSRFEAAKIRNDFGISKFCFDISRHFGENLEMAPLLSHEKVPVWLWLLNRHIDCRHHPLLKNVYGSIGGLLGDGF